MLVGCSLARWSRDIAFSRKIMASSSARNLRSLVSYGRLAASGRRAWENLGQHEIERGKCAASHVQIFQFPYAT